LGIAGPWQLAREEPIADESSVVRLAGEWPGACRERPGIDCCETHGHLVVAQAVAAEKEEEKKAAEQLERLRAKESAKKEREAEEANRVAKELAEAAAKEAAAAEAAAAEAARFDAQFRAAEAQRLQAEAEQAAQAKLAAEAARLRAKEEEAAAARAAALAKMEREAAEAEQAAQAARLRAKEEEAATARAAARAKMEREAAEAEQLRVKQEQGAAAQQGLDFIRARSIRSSEKAKQMLEQAQRLQADSEEQKAKAERLRAKCQERAERRAARLSKLETNPASCTEVDLDTSDDEEFEAMLRCSSEVQRLEATRDLQETLFQCPLMPLSSAQILGTRGFGLPSP